MPLKFTLDSHKRLCFIKRSKKAEVLSPCLVGILKQTIPWYDQKSY